MIVRITSKFGAVDAVHKTPHTGNDYAIPEGTTLRAVGDGIVDKVFDGSDKIGRGLSVQFDDGSRVIYGHMKEVSVKVGEHITNGEVVGLSGNTGHSTAPHLHIGAKDAAGGWLDPTPIGERVVKSAGDLNIFERFMANGRVGDGIGDIPKFSVWEFLHEKVAEVTLNGSVDFIADIAISLPIVSVVGAGVYCLINMFSKSLAKWGMVGTVIYGICVIKNV
ncbi:MULTISPECIES: M23 family metallopeptidase [Peribacillus]|uniref:M23 family metallopeptidase n=1 Tax=Peribacillus TaxID=2675229 RepID=UPI001F4D6B1C|nr:MULTISPECIES: M23 family metallopeptidase [unclassified Peribacillus]MCK1985190.1 M23 family metallopeptidase [Peribacillus sp. Aquil_B1]MCK2007160.1 M23 family metallopeptidase [Peribacillus sp. Aquil_B8]